MTLDEISALVQTGESETLEFKSTTGTRREAVRTICAMLNQDGGQVLFGVTPEGNVVGQQVSERTIEGLSNELQRIDPPAFPTVERVPIAEGREVLVVRVSQGTARPYAYRGTTYRRVGNTTVAMSAEEYKQMLFERMHSEQRWENQPATGWTVDDLDVGEIRRTVAEAVQRGSGTLKIAEQVSAAGLPPPEIEDDGGCVTVRFRHGQFVPQQRIESIKRQETILTLLERAADGLALRDIQVVLGPEVSQRQVRRVLEGLRNNGLVESTGPGPRARWKRTESD